MEKDKDQIRFVVDTEDAKGISKSPLGLIAVIAVGAAILVTQGSKRLDNTNKVNSQTIYCEGNSLQTDEHFIADSSFCPTFDEPMKFRGMPCPMVLVIHSPDHGLEALCALPSVRNG